VAVAWVALGGLIGALGRPWLLHLVEQRQGSGVTVGAQRWLALPTVIVGSAIPGLILLLSPPVGLSIVLFLAGIISWWLACIDAAIHRLPDPLTALLAIVLILGYGTITMISHSNLTSLVQAAVGGGIAFIGLFLLALFRRGALGFGDVKLGSVLGFGTAWFGFPSFLFWVLTSFISAGVVALGLLLTKKVQARDSIAFGPWLLFGAAVSIIIQLVEGVTH